MSTTWTGTEHSGQAAKKIFRRKNGAQHRTNVKKTKPNTLLAFCSVATAFAAMDLLLVLPARNLVNRFQLLLNSLGERNKAALFVFTNRVFARFADNSSLVTIDGKSINRRQEAGGKSSVLYNLHRPPTALTLRVQSGRRTRSKVIWFDTLRSPVD